MEIVKKSWPALISVLFIGAIFPTTRASALMEDAVDLRVESPQGDVLLLGRVLPEPGREVRLQAYLYRLADTLADAYADRRELPGNRFKRLNKLATELQQAAMAQRSEKDDWKYAAILMWIGHRETRLCHAPRLLGTEDNGKAHGYFQVWSWKNRDPYSADTAMDMMIKNPGAWSLPATSEPWVGYPEAAGFIREHPFQ
jgi:hypothetical protein